ncbi:MAG: hypothetical protein J7J44_04000, partial [Deltaproteobacteria bacterium]|nr:hypothetical protein [Deltaproteobacteria bacterium]
MHFLRFNPSIAKWQYVALILVCPTRNPVKLRYEEAEFLVRTELKGKAYLAFKAVGIRVPPRVIELNVVPTSSFTLK